MCFVELKAAILMVILNHPLQPSYLNTDLELLCIYFSLMRIVREILYFA